MNHLNGKEMLSHVIMFLLAIFTSKLNFMIHIVQSILLVIAFSNGGFWLRSVAQQTRILPLLYTRFNCVTIHSESHISLTYVKSAMKKGKNNESIV